MLIDDKSMSTISYLYPKETENGHRQERSFWITRVLKSLFFTQDTNFFGLV